MAATVSGGAEKRDLGTMATAGCRGSWLRGSACSPSARRRPCCSSAAASPPGRARPSAAPWPLSAPRRHRDDEAVETKRCRRWLGKARAGRRGNTAGSGRRGNHHLFEAALLHLDLTRRERLGGLGCITVRRFPHYSCMVHTRARGEGIVVSSRRDTPSHARSSRANSSRFNSGGGLIPAVGMHALRSQCAYHQLAQLRPSVASRHRSAGCGGQGRASVSPATNLRRWQPARGVSGQPGTHSQQRLSRCSGGGVPPLALIFLDKNRDVT
jgi:hypothetical protein